MCPNPAQLITFFRVINVPGLYIQGSKVSKVQSEQPSTINVQISWLFVAESSDITLNNL